MKLTREQAWQKAIRHALEHHREKSSVQDGERDILLGSLYAGLGILQRKMAAGELRTNDLLQLIACALDCLGVSYHYASEHDLPLLTPDEEPDRRRQH